MERTCTFKFVDFGNLKAFATVHFDDFEVRGFKVLESNDGPWIAMPSRETLKDGKKEYFDIVRFTDQDSKRDFSNWLIRAYRRELQSSNQDDAAQATVKRGGNGKNNGHSRS